MGVSHVGTIGGQKPMGHYNLTVPQSGPVSLPGFSAIDKNLVRIIVIQAVTQPITWRDDGGTPDGTNGIYVGKGDLVVYDADVAGMTNLLFLASSDATASGDVRIAYYGV